MGCRLELLLFCKMQSSCVLWSDVVVDCLFIQYKQVFIIAIKIKSLLNTMVVIYHL